MQPSEVNYTDGGRYSGALGKEDGLPRGMGKKVLPDGSQYVGNFQNGLFQGCGVLTLPDGSKYEGEFSNGKFHGVGLYAKSDGVTFCGEFRDGKIDGKGLITFADGTHGMKRQEGIFQNGLLRKGESCRMVTDHANAKAEEARSLAVL